MNIDLNSIPPPPPWRKIIIENEINYINDITNEQTNQHPLTSYLNNIKEYQQIELYSNENNNRNEENENEEKEIEQKEIEEKEEESLFFSNKPFASIILQISEFAELIVR